MVRALPSVDKFRAKKTPLGRRGIRVIVVVANSVSAAALGLWWLLLLVRLFFLLILLLLIIRYFWLRCLYSDVEIARRHRNLFCAHYIQAILVPTLDLYIKNNE